MPIKFTGLRKLSDSEVIEVRTLSKRYLEKLTRNYKNPTLKVHVKKEDLGGATDRRSRYVIKAHLEDPSFRIASESMEWDLSTALHKAFQKLENETKKETKP
jgi:ribosome-associated translation inhibitor RaiA